jgi:hypothetical protein
VSTKMLSGKSWPARSNMMPSARKSQITSWKAPLLGTGSQGYCVFEASVTKMAKLFETSVFLTQLIKMALLNFRMLPSTAFSGDEGGPD